MLLLRHPLVLEALRRSHGVALTQETKKDPLLVSAMNASSTRFSNRLGPLPQLPYLLVPLSTPHFLQLQGSLRGFRLNFSVASPLLPRRGREMTAIAALPYPRMMKMRVMIISRVVIEVEEAPIIKQITRENPVPRKSAKDQSLLGRLHQMMILAKTEMMRIQVQKGNNLWTRNAARRARTPRKGRMRD